MRKHVLADGAESKIGLDTCSSKSKVTVTTESEEGRPPRRRCVDLFLEKLAFDLTCLCAPASRERHAEKFFTFYPMACLVTAPWEIHPIVISKSTYRLLPA